MKIAIVCDWLITQAGSERVLGEILQCYPHADIFAVVDFIPSAERDFLLNKPVKTTFIQHLPFVKKRYRSYLPLMPIAIEQIDVSQYDLIISSSHAVAKGVITGPDQIHISYVHSPMRYAWDLQHQYLLETKLHQGLKGFIAKYFLHKMRLWDSRTANGVDYFIANSNYIARRIWKTYRRETCVIHPPIDILHLKPSYKKEEYYLTASRMVPYKKMDLIVEAFSSMPDKKLIVIGSGPEYKKIKAKVKQNIELLGFQPTAKLIHYLQHAKALVFAAEEDFGLIPVEAQACGTPVIAYGKGGALETVRDINEKNPTGVFFNEQNILSIINAVHRFEEHQEIFTTENCTKNAEKFSSIIFREKFKTFVEDKMKHYMPRN